MGGVGGVGAMAMGGLGANTLGGFLAHGIIELGGATAGTPLDTRISILSPYSHTTFVNTYVV